jgi:hypothetical protein
LSGVGAIATDEVAKDGSFVGFKTASLMALARVECDLAPVRHAGTESVATVMTAAAAATPARFRILLLKPRSFHRISTTSAVSQTL